MKKENFEAIIRCANSSICVPNCPYYMENGRCDQTRMIREMLELMPKHGEWTEYHTKCDKGYGQVYYQHEACSCQIYESPYNYCPNCGAKMGVQE